MKKIVVAVIVILIVLVGGFVLKVFNTPVETSTPGATSSQQTGSDSISNDDAQVVTIEASEYKFSPSTITVKAGQKVKLTFKNAGTMQHDWVVEGENISTSITSPKTSDTIVFTAPAKAGEYSTFCSIGSHRALGMTGKLIVE